VPAALLSDAVSWKNFTIPPAPFTNPSATLMLTEISYLQPTASGNTGGSSAVFLASDGIAFNMCAAMWSA